MKYITTKALSKYFKSAFILALPIALQSLTSFLVNIADNFMIGTLGEDAISGVYIGTQMFTLLTWLITGITVSMTILSTQYWGGKNISAIQKIAGIGFLISIPISIFLMSISFFTPEFIVSIFTSDSNVIFLGSEYLKMLALSFPFYCFTQIGIALTRSIENTKTGLYISIMSLFSNIGLNYILIFGHFGFPAMGCKGAAIATLISRILEFLFMTVYLFRFEAILKIKPSMLFKLDYNILNTFLKYGFPVFLGELVWGFNTMMKSYFMGHFPSYVIASFSICNLLSETAFVWILSLESAVGILTGKMIGEKKRNEEIKSYTYHMQCLFILIGISAVIFLFVIRTPFFSFYTISQITRQTAYQLSTISICIVFFSVYEDMTLCGIVKYGGETSFVLKTDSILVFLVMLPLCILASHFNAPASLIFFILQIDQIIKCFVAAVKANRFHWIHDLTTH